MAIYRFLRRFSRIAAFSVMMSAALSGFADNHPAARHHHPLLKGRDMPDSSTLVKSLHKNSPAEFISDGIPRFAIFGKEGKFFLGIGGYVKATASVDFGSTLSNPNEFITSEIAMDPPRGNGALTQISAQQTHIFLNFVGLPGTDNEVGAFVGFNFMNDNYAPQLQYAYLRYRGFKAGYDYSIFSDPAASLPTIDYEGPNVSSAIPTCLLSYSGSFGKGRRWTAGGGIEVPVASYTDKSVNGIMRTQTVNQRIPDIPAYIQYSWLPDSWIRFSAIYRNLAYRNVIKNKNGYCSGWGVQLSGTAEIAGHLRFYWQADYGKGIASHLQDLEGCGMDLCPSPDPLSGKLRAVETWGAFGGLQYNFTEKIYSVIGYSHIRNYTPDYGSGSFDGQPMPWSDQYSYAQYGVANLMWDINDQFTAGVEYIYGRRVNFSGAQNHDNRLQLSFQVSF